MVYCFLLYILWTKWSKYLAANRVPSRYESWGRGEFYNGVLKNARRVMTQKCQTSLVHPTFGVLLEAAMLVEVSQFIYQYAVTHLLLSTITKGHPKFCPKFFFNVCNNWKIFNRFPWSPPFHKRKITPFASLFVFNIFSIFSGTILASVSSRVMADPSCTLLIHAQYSRTSPC